MEPHTQWVRQRKMLSGQAPGLTALPTTGLRSVRLTYRNVIGLTTLYLTRGSCFVRLTYHNVAVNMLPAPHYTIPTIQLHCQILTCVITRNA